MSSQTLHQIAQEKHAGEAGEEACFVGDVKHSRHHTYPTLTPLKASDSLLEQTSVMSWRPSPLDPRKAMPMAPPKSDLLEKPHPERTRPKWM